MLNTRFTHSQLDVVVSNKFLAAGCASLFLFFSFFLFLFLFLFSSLKKRREEKKALLFSSLLFSSLLFSCLRHRLPQGNSASVYCQTRRISAPHPSGSQADYPEISKRYFSSLLLLSLSLSLYLSLSLFLLFFF